MGAGRRLVRFGGGSLLGAGLGGAAALLFAPGSGDDLRQRIRERLRLAKLAGAEAQAAKTEELVRRFRATVDDPDALAEAAARARAAATAAGLAAPTAEPSPALPSATR